MTKSGTDHKLGLTAITNLNHGRDGGLGLGNRRTPEFLRCVIDNLRHVNSPSPFNRKPVTKAEAHLSDCDAATLRVSARVSPRGWARITRSRQRFSLWLIMPVPGV